MHEKTYIAVAQKLVHAKKNFLCCAKISMNKNSLQFINVLDILGTFPYSDERAGWVFHGIFRMDLITQVCFKILTLTILQIQHLIEQSVNFKCLEGLSSRYK